MLLAKVIEVAKRLSRVVTDFWVVAFFLELINDDDRNNDFLLFETKQSLRVREQNRSVEHVRFGGLLG